MKTTETVKRIAFTVPAIAFVALFMAYPIIYSFVISLTNFDGTHPIAFRGLAQYTELFTSREFWGVSLNNLYFAALGIPLSVIVPLLIAVLLFEEVRGHRVFKVVYLVPSALAVAVVGMLFRAFFSYRGPINRLLSIVKLNALVIDWFYAGVTSIPIIILAMVWATYGVNTIIFLAAMSLIPEEVYESAELDGFSWFQRFYHLTMPMIISVFEFVTVMSVITIFSSMFSYIYTITGGGPGYESTVLEYLIFIKGFRLNNLAYASATSTVLFFLILILTVVMMRFFARKGDWQ